MCGRFSQALPAELMRRLFGAADQRREVPAPSWNVAPTASVTVAAWDSGPKRRVLATMTWGLLAPWEKHWETARVRPINARCETIATSGMFAPAFRQRRALVAVEAWYEWVKRDGQKIPHALARADRAPTALGGIWECWRSPIGDRMLTLAIVTTPAAVDLAMIHDRMPLVLAEPDWPIWLGEAEGDAAALMRPAPSGSIATWRVGRAVGNPRNNGADLLAAA
ncbi:MAG: SOS response-associated peptidase [Acetobacteraceae bacterium]